MLTTQYTVFIILSTHHMYIHMNECIKTCMDRFLFPGYHGILLAQLPSSPISTFAICEKVHISLRWSVEWN